MTKPTILVIAPTPYFADRGCHIRIYEELKLIEQLGYQPHIVTYPLGRAQGSWPIHRVRRLPWYRKTSAGPAWSKVILDLMMIPLTYRLAKQTKPKLIHAHLTESMLSAYWSKWLHHVPIVLDLQSVLDHELNSYGGIWKMIAPLARVYEWWAVRQADHVIVSNPKAASILKKRYPHTRITLVADGIGQIYHSATKPTYDIVYSGGLGPHKGTPELIKILQQFKDKKILIIAADPDNQWKKQIPHTTWIDHVPYEDLLPMLAQAKVGIEPKPLTSTEGSAKELNYIAAGIMPARSAADIVRLLANGPSNENIQLPVWSDQLPVLKHVYESCSA